MQLHSIVGNKAIQTVHFTISIYVDVHQHTETMKSQAISFNNDKYPITNDIGMQFALNTYFRPNTTFWYHAKMATQ